MRSNFYNNYLTEELLVKNQVCGGYLEQPICLYDFTVKTLSHDCLNFSTRHLTQSGPESFIERNYIGNKSSEPQPVVVHRQTSSDYGVVAREIRSP